MALMKKMAVAALATALMAGTAMAQSPTFFRIGTGGAGGTYFPIGGTIANGISSPPGSRPCEEGGQCGVPGLIAIAQSTTASVFNNAAVQNGELEAGLAAADVTREMYLGVGTFEGKKHDKLRLVANLFPEDLHLVMPAGATLDGLGDLAGKRVGIAQAGSGTQVAVLKMLEEWGVNRDNMEEAELNNSQSAERLADGQLDAFFYAAGWPVAAMVQLASTKGMTLYSFSDEEMQKINDVVPAYIPSKIPGGVYEGIDNDTMTPAVSAYLVVSSDLSDDLVYGITKALWNDNTRNLLDNGHAKGKLIRPETALNGVDSLGVPLHPGAERFYREAGLLK
ncbi:31 kDa immunogenic protein [Roseovarius sp. EC-HK134]|jgi:TRAP transporter TAXI family solute receptor|uniref:NMT1-like family protein n=1 Tax=Roseovarius mucosus TaxID=215743 RepID=A0A1V0RJQ6_9RHOB|nr:MULTISPECIES: TAXI family TRAP transporter solute-binding subunit [Roseovarius]MBS4010240.1 TAXI family TRAP transporter solute-binding subunit [Roseovarius sp.]ARE81946.1 NMT1-like family protein [Roseovarius mucosus]AWZ21983.1 TRAP transporter solute receptor, TAXI family precursor [Roseovarius sp. AK1035]MBW4972266.1 TAXI family TRAP transporter solute-binding subunit [Roseovarius mucosus]VVT33233.1 31 kDa immunogenic protein [Roseovarius sp. EC-SD190]|tara:strand:- start:836 stop:1846 length:1011 start_codon:yes stop_codon:yes gene_type:complete